MEKNTAKINFFKKIYYSIFKIGEYGNLSKEGLKKSIYYIMDVLFILAIIYSGIVTFQMKKNLNDLKIYLEQNLPEFTYVEGKLTSENAETVVLDNDLIKTNIGGQVVIDTKTEYDNLVNQYKEKKENTILLTTEKYFTVNLNGELQEYSYNEVLKQYFKQEVKSLDKEEFLYLFDNFHSGYYFIVYAISYCIAQSILLFAYTLFLTIVVLIVCKIKKINVNFKEVFCMGLYSMTIPVIGYFIINYIPITLGIYIQIITTMIPIVYLIKAIYVSKWITPEMAKKK